MQRMIPFLEQTWRWYGPRDPIGLADIRQAGATGIVTALHELPCGETWPAELIRQRKHLIESAGLRWSVVESVAVHEDIKRRSGEYERYIDNYRQTLRNLGACGVRIVCYNFMAVTDWTRTQFDMPMPSGALALRFDAIDAAVFDLFLLKRRGAQRAYSPAVIEQADRRLAGMNDEARQRLSRAILMGLPGTVPDLTLEEFAARLETYDGISSDTLAAHHAEFLKAVIPAAEDGGVVMAIHPDDPPFPMFGLPRIACDEPGLTRIVRAVDSPANGITFCSGSLGANPANDLPGMIRRLGDRIHFLHLRSVRREQDGSFFEDDHLAGSTDMAAIMREAIELMRRRGASLPMRPDHGHLMLSDLQRTDYYPGYSLIGRMKGLAELRGLELGLRAGMA